MILYLAFLMDGVIGEYPSAIHPVVWMGKLTSVGLRFAPVLPSPLEGVGVRGKAISGWYRQFFSGAFLTFLIVGLSAASAWLLLWLASYHYLLEVVAGAFFLKASFALRELGRAAMRVVTLLEAGNLPDARQALRSLCSRDPSDLSAEDMLAATIESLAENASDSLVAPLFYFVLFGVPGAVGYRAINTLDAMIGYRGKYEALGKFAARLDDVANFIPARLTALLFLSTGWMCGGNVVQGWRMWLRDAAKTPSPNGGRPMATMAGLLGVRLDKKGVYSLGEPREALTPLKVRQAWRIVVASCLVMVVLCGVLVWLAATQIVG
jgi:adenosylcobinamide-phosphate synthase